MLTVVPAATEPAAGDRVEVAVASAPGTVVIVPAVVPEAPPFDAVIVVEVPDTVCEVNVMVARPDASVLDVAAENDPLPFDFDHETTTLGCATALPFTSRNCAVTVTAPPAAGLSVLGVTRKFCAAP